MRSKGKNLHETTRISSESLILPPPEDINLKQERISGERFPNNMLELCDNCHWCCTCFNMKAIIDKCPMCRMNGSQIPMSR